MLSPTLQRLLLGLPLTLGTGQALAAHCIYINSYSPGYEWGDRIQRQFEQDIQAQCRVSVYYLDAKNTSAQQLKQKASCRDSTDWMCFA